MRLNALTGRRAQDLALSILGQGGSALLTLVYLRMAVRGFAPAAYGMASVWIGAHLFLRGCLVLPLLQLLIYRGHDYRAKGNGPAFQTAILKGLLLAFLLLAITAFAGLAYFRPTTSQWALGGLLVGSLGVAEGMRGFALNHFNLDERHGAFAVATLSDAALRVIILFIMLAMGGRHPALLVVVPLLATGVVAVGASGAWRADFAPFKRSLPLRLVLWLHRGFLLPIILLGCAAWITGVSDRYVLLRRVGEEVTGLYAAVYGLFSTPFAILSAALVQVFRPRMSIQHANAPGCEGYHRVHTEFIAMGFAGAILLALILWVFKGALISLMLRPDHRILLSFLPFLLFGQIAFAMGQLMEQGFYIRQRMGAVVIKQSVGAIAAILLMMTLIPLYGVKGAFLACAGYYTIEFLCGVLLYFVSQRSAAK